MPPTTALRVQHPFFGFWFGMLRLNSWHVCSRQNLPKFQTQTYDGSEILASKQQIGIIHPTKIGVFCCYGKMKGKVIVMKNIYPYLSLHNNYRNFWEWYHPLKLVYHCTLSTCFRFAPNFYLHLNF